MNAWPILTLLCTFLMTFHVDAFDGVLELRYAEFFHNSPRFKSVYKSKQPSYQVELANKFTDRYQVWANVDWTCASAKIKGCGSTRFTALNISFGVRALFFLVHGMDFYLGVGPSAGCVTLKNQSCVFKKKNNSLYPGAIVKSGLYLYPTQNLVIDFFVDYIYQPTTFHVDLGGIKIGLGLGHKF